jgi:hypothetical protein
MISPDTPWYPHSDPMKSPYPGAQDHRAGLTPHVLERPGSDVRTLGAQPGHHLKVMSY